MELFHQPLLHDGQHGQPPEVLDAVRQYPILEALCPHLRPADFQALAISSSDFRLIMKGPNAPTLPKREDLHPFQPVSRPCSCDKSPLADCPKHGLPTLRNLLGKTDRTCEEPLHKKTIDATPRIFNNWKSAICDALGGLSDVNSCMKCMRTVCFQCWWSHIIVELTIDRAQYACEMCWKMAFGRFPPFSTVHQTWRQAELRGDFCKCRRPIIYMSCIPGLPDALPHFRHSYFSPIHFSV